MDIQGKIIFASEVRGGVSQRSSASWQAQDFVIETHEQYPKKCCFTVFGEDRLKQFNLQVGEEVTVSVDIDAHEYQGRWFNDGEMFGREGVGFMRLNVASPRSVIEGALQSLLKAYQSL